jgi:hypothetical protein
MIARRDVAQPDRSGSPPVQAAHQLLELGHVVEIVDLSAAHDASVLIAGTPDLSGGDQLGDQPGDLRRRGPAPTRPAKPALVGGVDAINEASERATNASSRLAAASTRPPRTTSTVVMPQE